MFHNQRTITAVKRAIFTEIRWRVLCIVLVFDKCECSNTVGWPYERNNGRLAVGRIDGAAAESGASGASVNFNDSSNSTRRRRRTNERNPFDEITNEPAQRYNVSRPHTADQLVRRHGDQSDGWDGEVAAVADRTGPGHDGRGQWAVLPGRRDCNN